MAHVDTVQSRRPPVGSPVYSAVVAGHICLDVIPDLTGSARDKFERMFAPGRLLDVGPVTFSTGGAVSNTGLALNKLGIDALLMGKIGDDLFGKAIQQIVSAHTPPGRPSLTEAMVVDKDANSSYTVVINPPGLDRIFLHCPGANDTFSPDDVRYEVVARARLFHFGYPPLMRFAYQADGAQLVELFRRVRETGATTSLDMALPDTSSPAGRADWATILRSTLPYVDIFLPSIEEILFMLRRGEYEALGAVAAAQGVDLLSLVTPALLHELSDESLALGVKIAGIKLGYRGLYLRTAGRDELQKMGRACPADPAAWADRELWAPCFRVQVAGTTGSGDATIAGLLSALLRGLPAEAAARAAVAVGACNVEAPDALSGIRPWEETLRRIETGWPQHQLRLDFPGWHFDEALGLWVGPASTGTSGRKVHRV